MNRHAICALVALLISLPGTPADAVQSVFVRSGELGRGVLRARSGECFVITPQHVVAAGDGWAGIVGPHRIETRARHDAFYPPDIALLRIDPAQPLDCRDSWRSGRELPELLPAVTRGVLESREENGGLRRRPVTLIGHDDRTITVRAANPSDAIFQGLSGSLLRVQGRAAGMLMQVDASTAVGIVFRQDYLHDIVGRFFAGDDGRQAPVITDHAIEPLDFMGMVMRPTVLREAPTRSAPRLRILSASEVLRITGRVSGTLWYRVEARGRTAYVHKHDVRQL